MRLLYRSPQRNASPGAWMKILFLAMMATVAQGQGLSATPGSASEVSALNTWEVSWTPSLSTEKLESK